jgi:hypothetical protein
VLKCSIILLICLCFTAGKLYAQCTIQVRQYATTQQVNEGGHTSVSNPGNAVDGNPANSSTLIRNFGLFGTGSVVQFLKFGTQVTAGTPVTIKASFPASLVSLLTHVEIQPFTNLHDAGGGDWQADAAGKATGSTTIAGVLSGAGEIELTITPQTTGGVTVNYDGVWVKISGLITLGESMDVFHAFIMKDAPANVGCSIPVDVLAGVRAGTVLGGILNASGSVSNKFSAIDTDPTYTTYAEMNVGVQLLSQVYHTTIFGTSSRVGDKIRMVLQKPGGGLLDLSLLSGFTIQLYNGATPVGSAINSSSIFLSLSLLPGTAGNEKYQLDITPTVVYDRVEIQIGGLANAALTQGLRIYDVKSIINTPAINIDAAAVASKTVCAGNSATLAVNNTQTCTTYKWYDAASGGTLLYTGDTYTPTAAALATGANNFYVEASRNGCTEVSARTLATINVNPLPGITPGGNPSICYGTTTAGIGYTAATNTPSKYSIVWDAPALAAGFTNVTDATLPASTIAITVPAAVPAATYTGNLYVKNTTTTCTSAAMPFNVKVDAMPTQPVINLTP